MIKMLSGKKVDEALAILKEMEVEFEYEEETDVVIGSIIIGHFWGDHIEFEIEDGILLEGYEHYWD